MSAIFSECGTYRYRLTRDDVERPGAVIFLMLNPSTADASLDDPTIRRCKGFAKSWGSAGLVVANLYALRATNPADLWLHADPIGPENNRHLMALADRHIDIVCAWGANAKPERVDEVVQMLNVARARLWCLGTTKHGHPRHPLYVRGDTKLERWGWKQ